MLKIRNFLKTLTACANPKTAYADSSSIPDEEKKLYQPDEYYRFRPFAGTVFDGGTGVIVYDEAIKNAWKSPDGLYPPEIVAIYFCTAHPNKTTGYPGWYWFKYGIRDVGGFQRTLEKKGLIEKRLEDGKWIPTETGIKALEQNEFIVWAHRNPNIDGINAWTIGKILDNAPEKIKNYSWKDKVWWYMNNYCIQHSSASGLYRNMKHNMAEFLYKEGRYAEALKIADEVISLDKRSGDFKDSPDGVSPWALWFKRRCESKIKSSK